MNTRRLLTLFALMTLMVTMAVGAAPAASPALGLSSWSLYNACVGGEDYYAHVVRWGPERVAVGQTFSPDKKLLMGLVSLYDGTGARIWSQTYGDAVTNNVWFAGAAVAGDALYVGGDYDAGALFRVHPLIVKFSPSGAVLWAKRFEEAGADNTSFCKVLLPSDGNPVVVSNEVQAVGGRGIVVRKLSAADGSELWTRTYNTGRVDYASSATLDARDDIFVCGHAARYALLLKISRGGGLLWAKKKEGPQHKSDYWSDVRVVGSRIHVVGDTVRLPGWDVAQAAYDQTGALRLYSVWGTLREETPYAFAVTSGHEVVVAVSQGLRDGQPVAVLVKWTAAGARSFVKAYDSGGKGARFTGIALGPGDSVYVCGSRKLPDRTAWFVRAYTASGALKSMQTFADQAYSTAAPFDMLGIAMGCVVVGRVVRESPVEDALALYGTVDY